MYPIDRLMKKLFLVAPWCFRLISWRITLLSRRDYSLMLGVPFERMTYSSSIRSPLDPKRRANEAADPEFVRGVSFDQVITIT